MDTSLKTLSPTHPSAAVALPGPHAQAPAPALPPRVGIPMRAEVRRMVACAALGCAGLSMVGFLAGGVITAVVPMEPTIAAWVVAFPSSIPLMSAGLLGAIYYLGKPDLPGRPAPAHA